MATGNTIAWAFSELGRDAHRAGGKDEKALSASPPAPAPLSAQVVLAWVLEGIRAGRKFLEHFA